MAGLAPNSDGWITDEQLGQSEMSHSPLARRLGSSRTFFHAASLVGYRPYHASLCPLAPRPKPWPSLQ